MIAENVFEVAVHLPEKEMERLLNVLNKKINTVSITKMKMRKSYIDKEAIAYLLKNVFSKKK